MTVSFDIKKALNALPKKPGVYKMYDASGRLIYVGKAKNLRNRVRSYFQKDANTTTHSAKTRALVKQITRFETLVTDTEVEALILEDNLVKTHHPRFNILLRDDKRFPWLCITDEPFPRLLMVRRPSKKRKRNSRYVGARYFGPYSQPGNMWQMLKVLRKHFPMRQRKTPLFKDRPCMNFDMGLCPGPCQGLIDEAGYQETVEQVALFLNGKTTALIDRIDAQMNAASAAMQFEYAAKLRDRLMAIQQLSGGHQVIHSADTSVSLDAVGLAHHKQQCVIQVLLVREGKLVDSHTHTLRLRYGTDSDTDTDEVLSAFCQQYYSELPAETRPKEILLPIPLSNQTVLTEHLGSTLAYPQRGYKKSLLTLAENNAQEQCEQLRQLHLGSGEDDEAAEKSLAALCEALSSAFDLPDTLTRLECYDISHSQGSQTVGSMVVFTDGMPDKNEYKKFNIKTAEGKPDDFASMAEVITRRLKHHAHSQASQLKAAAQNKQTWPAPDLLIIDGGKGQLSAAQRAAKDLGLDDIPMISLAKKFEEIYVPNESRPILLPRDSAALLLLQKIRDEAHRFAITAHRQRRGKNALVSALDGVSGIGPKRKAKLLEVFKTLKALKSASIDELVEHGKLTETLATAVYLALHRNKTTTKPSS